MTGSVTFNLDTSNFSGALALSAGDTAFLLAGISSSEPLGGRFNYPATDVLNLSPYMAYVTSLNGNFTLVNGDITSWNLSGSTGAVGCPGGPGCTAADSKATSSPGR